MSDNEDLLGDDLGDHSLADYNLGNEEEDQLLADDYESGAPQNVPTSIVSYGDGPDLVTEYSTHEIQYNQPVQYQMQPEPECVVPNITVDVPSTSLPDHSTYAPYEPPPPVYETEQCIVPGAIPAAPIENSQIVPTDIAGPPNGDLGGPRERFTSERPPGAQRMPQIRDIPDSLDKVVLPRGGYGGGRGRTTWRNPQFQARFNNQYRRSNVHRGNFNQRPQFPPPQIRSNPPHIRPDIRPVQRPDIPEQLPPQMGPDINPEGPILSNMPMDQYRPMDIRPFQRFPNQFRPNLEEPRHYMPRPNFEPRPMFFQQRPVYRPFAPMREVAPNVNNIPQVTIRHAVPGLPPAMPSNGPRMEQEVRMLPVQLPPNLPPGGLAGKKVLINPHFKGNFTPVEGLTVPTYIPTRIQKSPPPLSPTLENKFGPIKDIDDAAERFIAEQRNALAKAATRKMPRRSPQRFVENTTIEIENELARGAGGARRGEEDDLLRRQEEFINANRAGLRRRMRSPTPPRRSPSPRRSPERVRPRLEASRPPDEDTEYRRRMREQESLRERVLRAKEARRRRNAQAMKVTQDTTRDRERLEKDRPPPDKETKPEPEPTSTEDTKPDTTRKSPEKVASVEKPEKVEKTETVAKKEVVEEVAEVNSTCETLTPPREALPRAASPERALTPPLPRQASEDRLLDSDDDLGLILDDIDDILSDEDDTGRFKEKNKPEPPKPNPPVDLRSKLPPKPSAEAKRPPRQKIVFTEDKDREEKKKKDKSPPRKTAATSSTKTDDSDKKITKAPERTESLKESRMRQRITFDNKEEKDALKATFSNRRVILQRKATQLKEKAIPRIEIKTDPSKPNPGIFSRAVRTALSGDRHRIVIKKTEEPQVEYENESDIDEDKLLDDELGFIAVVANLPHGMTDTRLKTLAGDSVQSLMLDKEERSAKITFKTTSAAESFKRKFNNKMVAASRLTVTLN